MAKSAAMAARALVRNRGESSSTAARVAGNEPAKKRTPSNPLDRAEDGDFKQGLRVTAAAIARRGSTLGVGSLRAVQGADLWQIS